MVNLIHYLITPSRKNNLIKKLKTVVSYGYNDFYLITYLRNEVIMYILRL